MTRTIVVGIGIGALLALHQYLLVACANTPLIITLLDIAALPLAFGLPLAGGFLASRGRAQRYTRHSAVVGIIAGAAATIATGIRWAVKPGIDWSAHHQLVQGVAFLLVFGHQVAFALVGGYFATRTRRAPPV